jgi:hypothetical protein
MQTFKNLGFLDRLPGIDRVGCIVGLYYLVGDEQRRIDICIAILINEKNAIPVPLLRQLCNYSHDLSIDGVCKALLALICLLLRFLLGSLKQRFLGINRIHEVVSGFLGQFCALDIQLVLQGSDFFL